MVNSQELDILYENIQNLLTFYRYEKVPSCYVHWFMPAKVVQCLWMNKTGYILQEI